MGDLCAWDAVQHSTQAVVRVIAPRDAALGSPTVRVIPRARRWGGQETDLSHLFAGGAAHPGEPQNSKLKAVAAVLSRIAASSELTQSMGILLNNADRNPDIDTRHQAQVCLAITRCVAAGGDEASLAFSKAPGLVEGLCRLQRDSEPFVRVSAEAALRLMGRCNEACGLNRRLLRAKWKHVLDVDHKPDRGSQDSPASHHRMNGDECMRGQRLVPSSTLIEAEKSKQAIFASPPVLSHEEKWTSSRTVEQNRDSTHSTSTIRNGQSNSRVQSPQKTPHNLQYHKADSIISTGMQSELKHGTPSGSPLVPSRTSSVVRQPVFSPT